MILSLPTYEVLEAMRHHRVIECGAGTGLWVRTMREYGLDAIGLDPVPGGPEVTKGTHEDLHQFSDRLLLTVWPPDATDLNEWVDVWGGKHFAFVGDSLRVIMPRGFKEQTNSQLALGDKGYSTFHMGVIEG